MSVATVGSTTTNYFYSALGQMIKKTVGSTTTLLMYDEAGHLLGEYSSSGALIQETVWLADIPVATLRPNGSTACTSTICVFYVHTDQLNAPRKVTQPSSNKIAWRWDADPFGTAAPNQNPASLGTFVYNLRFPGQYYQAETGLMYNYFRDYDPQTGRYLESDPIGLDGGINTYAYVDNDPVGTLDPNGESPLKIIKLCAEGYKVVKTVGFKQAVQALRRGENILADSTKSARQVAKSASDAKKPIRDAAHDEGYMKHYHPNPRTGGHVFYSVAAALTLAHYSSCQNCTESAILGIGDFFSPLSTPQDLIDITDALTDGP
jgi:RHS repeat-associated protein